jgi:hypothetical protein
MSINTCEYDEELLLSIELDDPVIDEELLLSNELRVFLPIQLYLAIQGIYPEFQDFGLLK